MYFLFPTYSLNPQKGIHNQSIHLVRRISTDINAQLVSQDVEQGNGREQKVVLEGQREVRLTNWDTNAQTLVVLDGVPLPIRVVQQVTGTHITVTKRDVTMEGSHLGSTSHHVVFSTAKRMHQGRVLLIHEVPTLSTGNLSKPVVANSTVPKRKQREQPSTTSHGLKQCTNLSYHPVPVV